VFHPGPVFAQVLLADEINRASPKTQSALLEAMEEKQVSVEGETRALPAPVFRDRHAEPARPAGHLCLARIAARPLPDAHLARLPRPRCRAPAAGGRRPARPRGQHHAAPAVGRRAGQLQRQVLAVHTAEPLLDYVQDLIAATRSGRWFLQGLSPRAGIALVRAAKAQALISGRDYVAPDDVQAVLPQTIAHRLVPVGDAGRGAVEQVRAMVRFGSPALPCKPCRPPLPPHPSPPPMATAAPPRGATPSRPGALSPLAARGRFQRWWQARLPLSDTTGADAAQRVHPAHRRGLDAGADAGGVAHCVHQFPAQPGLSAHLFAGGQRGGGHAHEPCHAARPDAAPQAPEPHFLGGSAALEVQLFSDRRTRRGTALRCCARHGKPATGPGPTCPRRAAPACRWRFAPPPGPAPRAHPDGRDPLSAGHLSASGPTGAPPRRCWCTPLPKCPRRRCRPASRAPAARAAPAPGHWRVRWRACLPPGRPAQAGGLEEGRQIAGQRARTTWSAATRSKPSATNCGWTWPMPPCPTMKPASRA
jgi:hypothetical protein